MKCPYCSSSKSKVVDKRDKEEEGITRRRRECLECSKRYTTYERVEYVDLNVEKRNGKVEQFNRDKLMKSVGKAVSGIEPRKVSVKEIVDAVELKVLGLDSTTVKTQKIGELVLEELKNVYPVAYLRYASVFKQFSTVDDFYKELSVLNDA